MGTNKNKKDFEEAGPYTGDESNQRPVDAKDLGNYPSKVVIENAKGKQDVVDVHDIVKAPLTEKVRTPVEEVTTRVSTDENTVVEEKVKETVPTKDPHPKDEGTTVKKNNKNK